MAKLEPSMDLPEKSPHSSYLMQSTNSRFYKSPSPDIYKKMKNERESLMNQSGEVTFPNTVAKQRRHELDTAEVSRRDAKWAEM